MARRCRYCKEELPAKKNCINVWQREGFCEIDCMTLHGLNKAEAAKKRKAEREAKAKRAKHRADKERIKTKADHAREAQQAFNAWVRLRDESEPCISCGRHHQGQYHAGHYMSIGSAPELRFNVYNVNKQCSVCNNHLSSNAIKYRIGLIEKYGQDIVDRLEGKNDHKRYRVEDLQKIKRVFRKRLKHQRWLNERKNIG